MKQGFYILLWVLAIIQPTDLPAADFFWIGGGGRWQDTSHWASVSGGRPDYTRLPGPTDRVYFDTRSFNGPAQTIQIDAPVYCSDMTWTGATGSPRFYGADTCHLFISGSLVLIPEMSFDLKGNIYFTAQEQGQSIESAGHTFRRRTYFEGTGSWILRDPLRVDSLLRFQSGTFFSNGQPLRCGALSVKPSAPLVLNFSTSTITITGRHFFPDNWWQREWLSAEFLLDNLQCNNPDAILDLQDSEPAVWLFGNSPFIFGTIRFSNPASHIRLLVDHSLPSGTQLRRLDLQGHTTLSGTLHADTLYLQAGKTYTLSSYQRVVIKHLEAAGTCAQPIRIQSDIPGAPAFIESASNQITATYVQLKDTRAIGGAVFKASLSSDLGGNRGWDILPGHTGSLYWIGGSGRWNDPAHWALESGGPGGHCIPSPADDVFFDHASFPSPSALVYLDSAAYCRSINWTNAGGNPQFESPDSVALHISGSLTLTPTMRLQLNGDLYFESDSPQNTLHTAGHTIGKNLFFNGNGGWKLTDSLYVRRTLYLQQGSLDAENQQIACQAFVSLSAFPRVLNIKNASLLLQTTDYQILNWQVAARNLLLYAEGSTLTFTARGTFQSDGAQVLSYHKLVFHQPITFIHTAGNAVVQADTLLTYQGATFSRRLRFRYWEAWSGYTYTLESNDTLHATQLKVHSDCSHWMELRSSRAGETAFLQTDQTSTIAHALIQDIHALSDAPLIASQSTDLGNNTGWTIHPATGRTIYWVNDSGSWSDPAHWSLRSGGTGGACPPSPTDTVYFDSLSFARPEQFVFTDGTPCYVFSLHISKTLQPSLNLQQLEVFGSLEADSSAQQSSIYQLTFRGAQTGMLQPANISLSSLLIEGSGLLQARQPLRLEKLEFRRGTFETAGYPMEIGHVVSFERYALGQRAFHLGSSHVLVTGKDSLRTWYLETPVQLLPGNAQVEVAHPVHLYQIQAPSFYQLILANENGHYTLEHQEGNTAITHLILRGDATLLGAQQIDSLVFTAGHTYRLDHRFQHRIVRHWYMLGNACRKIQLLSTHPRQVVSVVLHQAIIQADFVEMEDQQAVGTGLFYAGANSTNRALSNLGWVFGEVPGQVPVGILGADRFLCSEKPALTLDARTFSSDASYAWDDGSEASIRDIKTPGTYRVSVQFKNQCTIHDTIQIRDFRGELPVLPADTILCTGDTLQLAIHPVPAQVTWQWSDGSRDTVFRAVKSGQIAVSFQAEGCMASDRIQFTFQQTPTPELGADRSVCHGQTDTLRVYAPPSTQLRWQDGSTLPFLVVAQPGTYSVQVSDGRCIGADSIQVRYLAPVAISLGADTFFCEESRLRLRPIVSDSAAVFRWQNGSSGVFMEVTEAGTYWVEVQVGQCLARDTVQVSRQALPRFELGENQILCLPGALPLAIPLSAEKYHWSNGDRSRQTQFTQGGWIWAEAYQKGCRWRDSLFLTVRPAPVFSLGNDTIICSDQPLRLTAPLPGLRYRWQNGSRQSFVDAQKPGSYSLEISDGTCTYQDTIDIATRHCVRFQVYIPDAFSPDDNGINDSFQPLFPEGLHVLQFDLRVYDRWGSLCFQSASPEEGWDGWVRGQKAPQGAYYYTVQLRYRDEDSEASIRRSGEVTLLRR